MHINKVTLKYESRLEAHIIICAQESIFDFYQNELFFLTLIKKMNLKVIWLSKSWST